MKRVFISSNKESKLAELSTQKRKRTEKREKEKRESDNSYLAIKSMLTKALWPLKQEITGLREEIKELRNENNSIFLQNSRGNSFIFLQNSSQSEITTKELKIAFKAIQQTVQKTIKKTFIKIAKLNSLVLEQSIKLDN